MNIEMDILVRREDTMHPSIRTHTHSHIRYIHTYTPTHVHVRYRASARTFLTKATDGTRNTAFALFDFRLSGHPSMEKKEHIVVVM